MGRVRADVTTDAGGRGRPSKYGKKLEASTPAPGSFRRAGTESDLPFPQQVGIHGTLTQVRPKARRRYWEGERPH